MAAQHATRPSHSHATSWMGDERKPWRIDELDRAVTELELLARTLTRYRRGASK